METFSISALVVAIAEIGDKTQLLAIVLTARFARPWPVLAGIFVATIANHVLAATAGYYISGLLDGQLFRIAVACGFIAMAAWALVPDKEEAAPAAANDAGVFVSTLVAFFLVEIGDKTQIATTALAARFHDIAFVTAGTTAGMMLANAPAVFLGEKMTQIAPLRYVRTAAALVFLALGIWALAEALG
ncbi:MAG: TMEM165/GDT1 family protein [Hyphomonadaceae bacterium]|nr:MAG: hypothetical protein FD160_2481 [Caulobacteraceae bacterium]MBT9446380.1 TMEM165/GDT1 family protein [Hyphomonadaceae bacterium]TPW07872.1 MAG: hypothetical protein FD124_820 [Alphaproteobacteria bacterium]